MAEFHTANDGLTLPGDAAGFALADEDAILVQDDDDTERGGVDGTVKLVPMTKFTTYFAQTYSLYEVDPGNMPGTVELPNDDADLSWITLWYEAQVATTNRRVGDMVKRWDGVYLITGGTPAKISDMSNVSIDREDLIVYLDSVITANHSTWVTETADPDAGDPAKVYDHQYVIDGYTMAWLGTDDIQYLEKAKAILDGWCDPYTTGGGTPGGGSAVANPTYAGAFSPGTTYYGWDNVAFLHVMQWATATLWLCYNVLSKEVDYSYKDWARRLVRWVNYNLCHAFWDLSSWRDKLHDDVDQAIDRTTVGAGSDLGWFYDFPIINLAVALHLDACFAKMQPIQGAITGISQANPGVVTSSGHGLVAGERVLIKDVQGMTEVNNTLFRVGTTTSTTFQLTGEDTTSHTAYTAGGTWELVSESNGHYQYTLDNFLESIFQAQVPDGAMVYDIGNWQLPASTHKHLAADTAHAREPRIFTLMYLDALANIRESHVASAAKTLTRRLWNGENSPNIRFANYIDGDDSQFSTFTHATAGVGGMNAFMYHDWAFLSAVDPLSMYCINELLEYVRIGTNDSGTYQRNSSNYGQLELAASLLWGDKNKQWLQEVAPRDQPVVVRPPLGVSLTVGAKLDAGKRLTTGNIPTLTAGGWFRTASTATQRGMLSEYTGSVGWYIEMQSGTIRFCVRENANQKFYVTTGTFNDDEWHHVVLKWYSGTLETWVDGVQVANTKTLDATLTNDEIPGSSGAHFRCGVNSAFSNTWDGEVRGLFVSQTAENVATMYANDVPATLVGFFPCEDSGGEAGTNAKAVDAMGNDDNLTISGTFTWYDVVDTAQISYMTTYGFTWADGATEYYDSGGVSLVPEGVIIPWLRSDVTKCAAYLSGGTRRALMFSPV